MGEEIWWNERFAFLPVWTQDGGFVWLRKYWRRHHHWGWDFLDTANYVRHP